MPEVISLLSSPIESPLTLPKPSRGKKPLPSISKDLFQLSSDGFDFTGLSGDLDFPVEQPSKKRRLSPEDARKPMRHSPRKPQKATTFLSDDDDLLPQFASKNDDTNGGVALDIDNVLSDPIVVSSSAPELGTRKKGKAIAFDISDGLSDGIPALDDILSQSNSTKSVSARPHLAERTANLLANIVNDNSSDKPAVQRSSIYSTVRPGQPPLTATVEDEIAFSSSAPVAATKSKGKDDKAAARATAKIAKEKEKEAEKDRKQLLREQKAREKQEAADIAAVNKAKTDKKVSVTEMVVEMSSNLQGRSVGNQVAEYMKQLGVEFAFFDEEIDLTDDGLEAKGNLVKWKRKVQASYNEDARHWEPLTVPKIDVEDHVLIHVTATAFAALVTRGCETTSDGPAASEDSLFGNIDKHVAGVLRKQSHCKPIYLIEGLEAFVRKNKNAKNRAYTAAVRSRIPSDDGPSTAPPASSQARRKKKPNPSSEADYSFIDTDLAETLLLHLQLSHSVLVHHTTSPADTAFWIRNFTEHISTIPYRHERMALNDAGAAFCMDVGQVKTGDDAADTYVKMLQEVQRVTPAMAYGIANLYPNVRKLVKAFRNDGPLVLGEVKKGANRDGAVTDRRLGPQVSKRLYKVFMGKDPWSTDGIA